VESRLSDLEGQREKLLEFSFQSILVVLTILGLAAALPVAIFYGRSIAPGYYAVAIIVLLFAIAVMMFLWLRRWWKVNVPPPRPKPAR
jgi:hypothetical protein